MRASKLDETPQTCSRCNRERELEYGLCEECRKKIDSMNKEKDRPRKRKYTKKKISELVAPSAINLQYDIIKSIQLVVNVRATNLHFDVTRDFKLVAELQTIFGNNSNAQIFFYFCRYRAATAWNLQKQLSLSKDRVYRSLRTLEALGYIDKIKSIPAYLLRGKKGGPRSMIYGLSHPDFCNSDDVAHCMQLHVRSLSPKYQLAGEIAQSIITDYLAPKNLEELTRDEIVKFVRTRKTRYPIPDMVELTITNLHDKGVKVWR